MTTIFNPLKHMVLFLSTLDTRKFVDIEYNAVDNLDLYRSQHKETSLMIADNWLIIDKDGQTYLTRDVFIADGCIHHTSLEKPIRFNRAYISDGITKKTLDSHKKAHDPEYAICVRLRRMDTILEEKRRVSFAHYDNSVAIAKLSIVMDNVKFDMKEKWNKMKQEE